MTGTEKYQHWKILSDYDIETAKLLLENQRYNYVAVLCEQAVERMIKGMFIYHTGKETPKSHNIPFLVNRLATNERFSSTEEGNRFEKERLDYENIMVDLMFYYISDYPFSYKKFQERFIPETVATELFERTLQFLGWLNSFQKTEE
ncbi:MAG: HEPN domain-containing protein [Eubacteriales bacterium]|nr:HEPN domain-containing protein [Eubacteriales bacterium]